MDRRPHPHAAFPRRTLVTSPDNYCNYPRTVVRLFRRHATQGRGRIHIGKRVRDLDHSTGNGGSRARTQRRCGARPAAMRRPDDDAKQWGIFGYESNQDARLRNHRSGTVDFHFWHSIAPTCWPIPGQRLSRAGFRVDAQLDGIWPLPHERCWEASTNFAASTCWRHHNLSYPHSIGTSRPSGLTTRWRRARKAARLHASCHDRCVTSERGGVIPSKQR